MPPRLGELIEHAHEARHLTLRRLANQVMKEDGISISPRYLWKCAAILRYVAGWELTHTQGWTIDPAIADCSHLVHMLVEPEVLQQVQAAAAAHGTSITAWLRHAMRPVPSDGFPSSWPMTTHERRAPTTQPPHDGLAGRDLLEGGT